MFSKHPFTKKCAKRQKLVLVNRFYAPDVSATSQILTDIAEALSDGGELVSVFASRMSYDGKSTFPKYETINSVQVYRVWSTRFGRHTNLGRLVDYLTFYIAITVRLSFFVAPGDILVAKTDPPVLSIPLGVVARIKRVKLVNWLQDIFPEVAVQLGFGRSSSFPIRALRYLRNRSLRHAAMNIVIGARMAEKARKLQVAPEKIAVIGNFVDDQFILRSEEHSSSLRKAWGLKESDFVIGYSGNLGRAHDLDTMLDTAERLLDSPQFVFLFIGGGALHSQLQSEVKRRGLTNIVLQPYQPRSKLHESLALPDLHWASLEPKLEGLIVPSKIYGIAAAGRPLLMIGDPNGEVGRILSDYPFGKCVPPGDHAQVEAFVRSIQRDPSQSIKMGRLALD